MEFNFKEDMKAFTNFSAPKKDVVMENDKGERVTVDKGANWVGIFSFWTPIFSTKYRPALGVSFKYFLYFVAMYFVAEIVLGIFGLGSLVGGVLEVAFLVWCAMHLNDQLVEGLKEKGYHVVAKVSTKAD